VGEASSGHVGILTVKQIIADHNMREVAYLESKLIPPAKIFVDGVFRNVPPALRVYANAKQDLLAVVVESALPPTTIWRVADTIMDWLISKGVSEIIYLYGAPAKKAPKKREIYAVSSHTPKLAALQKQGIKETSRLLILGIGAGMLDRTEKVPWIILLTPTFYGKAEDIKAATAKLTESLTKILELR
jgi:predicted ATP-grasp superfamily ATP-dependent carboligase